MARKTVLLFDRIQLKTDKESNVLALACAFILLCRRLKVNVQDAFTAAGNLLIDRSKIEDQMDDRFAAISMHLRDDYN